MILLARCAVAALLAAGCSASAPAPALSNTKQGVAAPERYRMRLSGLGPLDYNSEATPEALRKAFPDLTVNVNDLGDVSGIVFDVYDGKEKLFYVVPDEEEPDDTGKRIYAKTIFTIFATSPRITVEGYTWRVGQPLQNADGLERCECWGSGEVTACAIRAHLAVIFEESCEPARAGGPNAMIGHRIGRIMWERVAKD